MNKSEKLISSGDRIVAAVSGGPDSAAMLLLLASLRYKQKLSILVAHMDHGLQKDSRRFMLQAKALAKRFEMPFFMERVNVANLARKSGHSLEEAGRDARYAFLVRAANQFKAKKIATAHTQDDQVETILLRLMRGASLRGLAGIPARRKEGGCEVIRPILNVTKRDCLDLLKREKLPFTVDRTNKLDDFTRNRVRNRLLPMLEKDFNPAIRETLSQLQRIASDAQDKLETEAEATLQKLRPAVTRQQARMRIARFNKLHPAIAREVIYLLYKRFRTHAKRLSFKHIEAVRELASNPMGRGEVSLPGTRVRLSKGSLILQGAV